MDISTDSEEEDEVEFMFLILPTLHQARRRARIPMHTSILTGALYIWELLEGHPTRCHNILRMESHIFQALYNHLRSTNLLQNSRGVSVEEQLGIFMYMLSRNASFRTLTDRFQHSPETIHRHISSCFHAITSLTSDLVKPPTSGTHWTISSNPLFWLYFEVHVICDSLV